MNKLPTNCLADTYQLIAQQRKYEGHLGETIQLQNGIKQVFSLTNKELDDILVVNNFHWHTDQIRVPL